jgi:hypothetical protein
MKTNIRLYALILALFPLAVSCKKDDNGTQNLPTEIVIQMPTAGQIVLNGTNLRVEGTVTDNNVIANVTLQIRNKTTGAVLYASTVPTANVTFVRYIYNWTVSGITTQTVATVKVTGRDVGGNEGFKEVDVTLEP